VDIHDRTNDSESPNSPFTSLLKQPLNSRHPATRYNRQFTWLYSNNTLWPRFRGHSSTRLSTIASVVQNLTLD